MRIDRGAGGTAARHGTAWPPRRPPVPSPGPPLPSPVPYPGPPPAVPCPPSPAVAPLGIAPERASFPRRPRRRGHAQGAGVGGSRPAAAAPGGARPSGPCGGRTAKAQPQGWPGRTRERRGGRGGCREPAASFAGVMLGCPCDPAGCGQRGSAPYPRPHPGPSPRPPESFLLPKAPAGTSAGGGCLSPPTPAAPHTSRQFTETFSDAVAGSHWSPSTTLGIAAPCRCLHHHVQRAP